MPCYEPRDTQHPPDYIWDEARMFCTIMRHYPSVVLTLPTYNLMEALKLWKDHQDRDSLGEKKDG